MKKGFSTILGLVLGLVLVIAVGFVVWKKYASQSIIPQLQNTLSPKVNVSPSPVTGNAPVVAPAPMPAVKTDVTKDWKTYRNEKYGFEVKYPPNNEIHIESDFSRPGGGEEFAVSLKEQSKRKFYILVVSSIIAGSDAGMIFPSVVTKKIMVGQVDGKEIITKNKSSDPLRIIVSSPTLVYVLYFYGVDQIIGENEKILSTFKFTK